MFTFKRMAVAISLKRFQGCLVGAVVGDCIGANFEAGWFDRVEIDNILTVKHSIEKGRLVFIEFVVCHVKP